MSSLYPQQNGVVGNGSSSKFTEVMGDRPSMSEHFKQNGYYSARVSKIYHMRVPGDITAGVDGPDHAASWSERFNCHAPEWMTEGEHIHLTNEKLKRDPDKHYNLGFGGAFYVVKSDKADGSDQADVMAADKAIELLGQHKDEPFFLGVGLVRPHVPLVAPRSYFDPYSPPEMLLPERVDKDWADIPKLGISKNSKGSGIESFDKQREVLAAYYACVEFMDAQVGRILDELDRLGLREKTIVVFTADHGYHLGEHDFWQKMSLHEESTRIPILIDAPGHSAAVANTLAEQIDIYPTLAELAGLPIPDHCQGVSLVPAMNDPEQSVREDAYCYKSNGHLLRTDRWAYLSWKDGTAELYDMQDDPQQFTNLADHEEHRKTRLAMQQQLDAKLQSFE